MYSHLNHVNICLSYTAVFQLIGEVSKLHKDPIHQWIKDGVTFKFIGDNVDKKKRVRDVRSDHQGEMLHMYSVLVARSCLPSLSLSQTGEVANLTSLPWVSFLPTQDDIQAVQSNLVALVSRLLTTYIKGLLPFSESVPKHIIHQYSREMSKKSEVVVLDILMKNEASGPDMIDSMQSLHGYLRTDYPSERTVLSGGDQLTCERQAAAQRHMMDADTPVARLQLLEPELEDWHCLVRVLTVIIQQEVIAKLFHYLTFLCRLPGNASTSISSPPVIMAPLITSGAGLIALLSPRSQRRLMPVLISSSQL